MKRKLQMVSWITLFILLFSFPTGTYGFSSSNLPQGLTEDNSNQLLPFTDVQGHWAEAFIAEMSLRSIMKGYADNTFKPNKPVTQLEALVMMVRMLGFEPGDQQYPNQYLLQEVFKVPEWAIPYTDFAIQNEIIFYNEIEQMTFHQPLVRQHAAFLIVRSLGFSREANNNSFVLNFSDAYKVHPDLTGFVKVAVNKGILKGSSKGELLPNNPMSRAEMAAMLSRAFSYAKEQPDIVEVKGYFKSASTDEGPSLVLEKIDSEFDLPQEVATKLPSNFVVYKENRRIDFAELSKDDFIKVLLKEAEGIALIIVEPKQALGSLAYEKLMLQNATNPLVALVQELRLKEGFFAFTSGEELYLLACRGEKNTSGFSIDIDRIIAYEGEYPSITVYFTTTDPTPGSFYNPVLTYPYVLVKTKIENLPVKIVFKDQKTGTQTEVSPQELY